MLRVLFRYFRPNMLKHVREKHPEARIPMVDGGGNGGGGREMVSGNGRVLAIEQADKEEIDVKTDGRQQAIEYTDHHTISEVRVSHPMVRRLFLEFPETQISPIMQS